MGKIALESGKRPLSLGKWWVLGLGKTVFGENSFGIWKTAFEFGEKVLGLGKCSWVWGKWSLSLKKSSSMHTVISDSVLNILYEQAFQVQWPWSDSEE